MPIKQELNNRSWPVLWRAMGCKWACRKRCAWCAQYSKCVCRCVNEIYSTNTGSTAIITGGCAVVPNKIYPWLDLYLRRAAVPWRTVLAPSTSRIPSGISIRLAPPPFICAAHFSDSGKNARDPPSSPKACKRFRRGRLFFNLFRRKRVLQGPFRRVRTFVWAVFSSGKLCSGSFLTQAPFKPFNQMMKRPCRTRWIKKIPSISYICATLVRSTLKSNQSSFIQVEHSLKLGAMELDASGA